MDMEEMIFEDYRMLREEALQSMKNRNAILTFGFGVLGVIFHSGISSFLVGTKDCYWLSFFIFYAGIPAVSLLILTLWFGEAARMNRVGAYLMEREKLINLLAGSVLNSLNTDLVKTENCPAHFDKVVFWENYIRESVCGQSGKTRQIIFPYKAVIVLFFGIFIISVAAGILFPLRLLNLPGYMSIIVVIPACLTVLTAALKFRRMGIGME